MTKFKEIVLVVDDESRVVRSLRAALGDLAPVVGLTDPREAAKLLESEEVGLAIVDQRMPEMQGTELLSHIVEKSPNTIRFLLTGYADLQAMSRAINEGSIHRYIEKPWDVDRLRRDVSAGLDAYRAAVAKEKELAFFQTHSAELQGENEKLRLQLREMDLEDRFITLNPDMKRTLETVERIAKVSDVVLICGESGTGKELIAKRIHEIRHGAKAPLVPLNCGALSEGLVESELFGHNQGAFTGAVRDFPGAFERAEGGTVFLDEIGDLRWDLQVKLLRVLEEGKVRRIGGTREEAVDVSILAATNKDLRKMVAEGVFREDLYFRLSVIELYLTPLSQRPEDIPLLLGHFLNQVRVAYDRPRLTFSEEASAALTRLPFPGNGRELRNLVRKVAAVIPEDLVELQDLKRVLDRPAWSQVGESIKKAPKEEAPEERQGPFWASDFKVAREKARDEAAKDVEQEFLAYWHQRAEGSVTKMAELTGLTRGYLYRMAKHSGYDIRGE